MLNYWLKLDYYKYRWSADKNSGARFATNSGIATISGVAAVATLQQFIAWNASIATKASLTTNGGFRHVSLTYTDHLRAELVSLSS